MIVNTLRQKETKSLRQMLEIQFLIDQAEKYQLDAEYIGCLKMLLEIQTVMHRAILLQRLQILKHVAQR
jgi:hypothetical protein